VDHRAGLDNVEKRKFLTLPGLKLRLSVTQPVASHYTDYATPAPTAITVFRLNAEIMSPPRNVTIQWWDMEIIANLIEKRDKEPHQKQLLLLPSNKTTERAKMFTGKSQSSILSIRKKHKQRNATIWPSFSHHNETRDENIQVIMCLQRTLINVLSEIQFSISIFR
jgi:hypothetical protein